MHTVFDALVILLASLVALQARDDATRQEKERQEQLEKQLAEYERTIEKEEWVAKVKRSNAELARLLDKADQIDLFRLNHRPLPGGNKTKKREFHGYEILSEVVINAKEQRKEASLFLGKTLHWNLLRMADCFNPRHGLSSSFADFSA